MPDKNVQKQKSSVKQIIRKLYVNQNFVPELAEIVYVTNGESTKTIPVEKGKSSLVVTEAWLSSWLSKNKLSFNDVFVEEEEVGAMPQGTVSPKHNVFSDSTLSQLLKNKLPYPIKLFPRTNYRNLFCAKEKYIVVFPDFFSLRSTKIPPGVQGFLQSGLLDRLAFFGLTVDDAFTRWDIFESEEDQIERECFKLRVKPEHVDQFGSETVYVFFTDGEARASEESCFTNDPVMSIRELQSKLQEINKTVTEVFEAEEYYKISTKPYVRVVVRTNKLVPEQKQDNEDTIALGESGLVSNLKTLAELFDLVGDPVLLEVRPEYQQTLGSEIVLTRQQGLVVSGYKCITTNDLSKLLKDHGIRFRDVFVKFYEIKKERRHDN